MGVTPLGLIRTFSGRGKTRGAGERVAVTGGSGADRPPDGSAGTLAAPAPAGPFSLSACPPAEPGREGWMEAVPGARGVEWPGYITPGHSLGQASQGPCDIAPSVAMSDHCQLQKGCGGRLVSTSSLCPTGPGCKVCFSIWLDWGNLQPAIAFPPRPGRRLDRAVSATYPHPHPSSGLPRWQLEPDPLGARGWAA